MSIILHSVLKMQSVLKMLAQFALVLLFSPIVAFAEVPPHDIYLVVLVPLPLPDGTPSSWNPGPVLFPAARIAAEEINNSTEVLPNYNLRLIQANSACEKIQTAYSLVELYETSKQIVGIVGPGCTGPAILTSDLTSKYEVSLIHVTPSATSPSLEDPSRNTTFATISSSLIFVDSSTKLILRNKWSSVATFQEENRAIFRQTHSIFFKSLNDSNITVAFTGNMYDGKPFIFPLNELRASRARVVMVFAGNNVAKHLLCYAFHEDMLYPNYQWIFHERSKESLVAETEKFKVRGRDDELICTEEQMEIASRGIILNEFSLKQDNNKEAFLPGLNKTVDDFFEDYRNEVNDKTNIYANTYHDAVWAMAIALHNASENGLNLMSYTYSKNNETLILAEYLKQVNFTGVSGPIVFRNETRSTASIININQLWRNRSVLSVGSFEAGELNIDENTTFFFIDDSYGEKHIKVHPGFGVIIMIITLVLAVCTALLQIANTIWYHYRSIKATSPNLTNLVFSGCYLFAIAILVLSAQESFVLSKNNYSITYAVLCNTFTWCFLCGYSLIFGTVCVKIWRVYRLFKHFRNESPGACLSDNALIIFVIFLLFVDIIICITWNLYDPWLTEIQRSATVGELVLSIRSGCRCNYFTQWVAAIVVYKGSITFVLVALSILNRRIKRKDFQHTRKINILIYGITMMAGVGMPLYFLLDYISIYIGYTILCALLNTTILLCILTLFLPPVLPVIKMKITGFEEFEKRQQTSIRRSSYSERS